MITGIIVYKQNYALFYKKKQRLKINHPQLFKGEIIIMEQKNNILLPIYSFGVLALLAAILIIPSTRSGFEQLTSSHCFIMGFFKFAMLATAGELFSRRLNAGYWQAPCYLWARWLIWGVIGLWITYMMKTFSFGVSALMQNHILTGGDSLFLKALYTSITMNLSFGPTFMALHKCSYQLLEQKKNKASCSLQAVLEAINWQVFVKFTLFKTIPLFWIPAHTITFMLPANYQVTVAALLSVALGIILSIKK